MAIEPGVDPLESSKTSFPSTDRDGLNATWKSRAVGAPSRTREIKSRIAFGDGEGAFGLGHITACVP